MNKQQYKTIRAWLKNEKPSLCFCVPKCQSASVHFGKYEVSPEMSIHKFNSLEEMKEPIITKPKKKPPNHV